MYRQSGNVAKPVNNLHDYQFVSVFSNTFYPCVLCGFESPMVSRRRWLQTFFGPGQMPLLPGDRMPIGSNACFSL